MKSLQDFKHKPVIIEEKTDYSKFDMLVRAGLANKSQLARLHRVLDKMKEDRPVFNPTERNLVQGLFNKMVDIISNNKQIFQQTRRAVREGVEELDESIIDTADYKIGPSGRKVRAHRIKVGDEVYGKDKDVKEEFDAIEAEDLSEQKNSGSVQDPPYVLMLKRKAIRLYPNKTKVALYYNQRLNRYFSVPYGPNVSGPLQAEETEYFEESVMDQLHKIVANKQSNTVKFANGQTRKVDHYTASAITQVHKAVNDENKKKLSDMVHKSPTHLDKVAEFAFSKTKK
jgi:hypothetical protein